MHICLDNNESPDIHVVEDIENIPPSINEESEEIIPEEIEDINEEEDKLPEDILEILGFTEPKQSKGQALQKDIVQLWSEILKNGLKKADKEDISENNLPFDNCPLMIPPKLNPEVNMAINDPNRKRDHLIEIRQKQISTVLACLGAALQLCVKGDIQQNKATIIKKINEGCKMLCDSFFLDTRGRRSLILSTINKNMKESLLQTEPLTYLFGDNLTEKIKTAKSVQRSGQDLKISENYKRPAPKQTTTSQSTSKNAPTKKTLNWRGPPRPGLKAPRTTAGGPTYSSRVQKDRKKEDTRWQLQRNRK